MRLIDGSALLKELRKAQKECEKYEQEMGSESVLIAVGLDEACGFVKSAPTVDANPVVRAIREKDKDVPNLWRCSNCRVTIGCSRYCPNCGAKLDSIWNKEES